MALTLAPTDEQIESPNMETASSSGKSLEGDRMRKKSQARACEECNRKKTKCDKKTPRCSLCSRTGLSCTYPTRRRRHDVSSQHILQPGGEASLNRLLDQIDEGVLHEALLRRQHGSNSSASPQIRSPQNADGQTDELTPPEDASTETAVYSSIDFQHQLSNGFSLDFLDDTPRQWVAENLLPIQDSDPDLSGSFDVLESFPIQTTKDSRIGGAILDFSNPSFMSQIFSQAVMEVSGGGKRYSLSVPASVADNLIDVYFQNIAGFIPLFHRPKFYEQYQVHSADHHGRYQDLTLEDALVFNVMFALSARFSGSAHFAGVPIKERAEQFLRDAKALYHDAMSLDAPTKPNPKLLQGFTLLGWCYQLCGNAAQSWILSGICCHISYELGLNNIDKDIIDGDTFSQWTSVEDWSSREDLRRLWWLVWELDMFSSTVLRRPHAIDKTQMSVLLPVSDENYFTNSPLPSAPIIHDQAWKSLTSSPNQDARAWFLVTSFLRALSHDLLLNRRTNVETLIDFQSLLTCFSIVLPSSYQLGQNLLCFDDNNFPTYNWIITIHLMLQTIQSAIRVWSEDTIPESSDILSGGTTADAERLISRVVRNWEPKYMPLACPLICTLLIGPSASNVNAACCMAKDPENPRPIFLEMLKLVIESIGAYWEIGSAMLELIHLLESRAASPELFIAPSKDLQRLPLLLPKFI